MGAVLPPLPLPLPPRPTESDSDEDDSEREGGGGGGGGGETEREAMLREERDALRGVNDALEDVLRKLELGAGKVDVRSLSPPCPPSSLECS